MQTAKYTLVVQPLRHMDYLECWHAMRAFTDNRTPNTPDEIWLIEHDPVYTLGQAGKPEHILNAGNIPVVRTDRGGQVTYHGLGQLIVYPLLDIRRLQLSIRELVSALEKSVTALLAGYGIAGSTVPDAPGVYVQGEKISSIGLRIRRGCSYHGLALNVAMDLHPFSGINPCGYTNLPITQLSALGGPSDLMIVAQDLLQHLTLHLGYTSTRF